MKLIEEHSGWRLAFHSGTVQMAKIDFRLGFLVTDGADTADVVLETSFGLVGPRVETTCNPEQPETLSPVLALVNKKILEIKIEPTGHMDLLFEGSTTISVEPSTACEAWQVSGSTGFLLACQPDGRVSFFRDQASPAPVRSTLV